jgi:HK97 gp10 family phage protein
MVGVVNYKITGLDKLEQKLKGLGPAVATRIGADSLTAAAQPITKEMRRLVPTKTGALKRSITSRAVRATGGPVLSRIIGFRSPGRFYSHLVEFGTVRSSAKPFIRPALDGRRQDALLNLGARLWRGIEAYAIGRVLTSLKEDEA